MRGLLVAVRTCSRTSRETCAAGASSSAWPRRCPKPSRGGRPVSAGARPRSGLPRGLGARSQRSPARGSPGLPALWEHASAAPWCASGRVGSRWDVASRPPSSSVRPRGAVRSWLAAAAAIAGACSFHGHTPIPSNPARGLHFLASKIALVQSVHLAHGWPQRAAPGTQWQRWSPWSHRSRDSPASLPQRGHVTPSGQRPGRKASAACRFSCRDGMRCCIGLRQRDVSNHIKQNPQCLRRNHFIDAHRLGCCRSSE